MAQLRECWIELLKHRDMPIVIQHYFARHDVASYRARLGRRDALPVELQDRLVRDPVWWVPCILLQHGPMLTRENYEYLAQHTHSHVRAVAREALQQQRRLAASEVT